MSSFPPGFLFQPSPSPSPSPSLSLSLSLSPSLSRSGSGSRSRSPSRSLSLSFGSGVIPGSRSSGSAFSPYSPGPAAPHLPPYGAEPRAAAGSSFLTPAYDPSSGLPGTLDYPRFLALGPYPYGDPGYRKNATRDATSTLKTWLHEHRKNPYPTKGEKIMLAIVTKMTLTQVSTWFANARRRLKKENKMTWTPRTRSEDEEDEDNVDLERHEEEDEEEEEEEDKEPARANEEEEEEEEAQHSKDASHRPLMFRNDGGSDRGFADPDFKDSGGRRLDPAPPQTSPLESSPPPMELVRSCGATQGPNVAPKPKLWSLAEIATSSDKTKGCKDSCEQGGGASLLPRRLYCPAPLMSRYSSYDPLGPLHTGPGSTLTSTDLNRLEAAMLQRGRADL